MRDVTIIGGGPAGMTAAIYAARKKLDQLVVSPDVGGQAAWASSVENYLGYIMISGIDLAEKFETHVKQFHVDVVDSTVVALERRADIFVARLADGTEHESRAVVVASGRSARNLGVPGEEEYKGRGVAYCATCDAPLFAGEDVAVIGSGNAGLSAAEQLAKIANRVYVIEELSHITGDPVLTERLKMTSNVSFLIGAQVFAVTGNTLVNGIAVRDAGGTEMKIPVAGVFVEIGSLPNTGFLPKELQISSRGEVEIDCSNKTNIPGLFAAGDVTNVPHKQIIIAAGKGAKALLSAYDYIVRTFEDGARG
jgi:alkyl hydroperoxide reductase subunit F